MLNISVVIPVYNEEGNVKELFYELKDVFSKLVLSKKISNYEIIFINDGSKDNTQNVLESIKKQERKLKVIELRTNFGKAEAYKAGFSICSGDLIFTMDGDLQDNPQNIPDFLEKINKGYDVVIGWKYDRKDPYHKKIPSKIFNFILRKYTKLSLHDFDNGYRCIRKSVLPYLELYEGLYRYIPIFAHSKGFKITEVKVNHRKRKSGKSKYGFSRLFKGFFDLITIRFLFSYNKRPLHFFGGIGTLFFSLGFIFSLYLSYLRLFLNKTIGNRPLLTFSVLLMILGLQLILFGLLGEMIAHISRKEKTYSIRKILK